MRDVSGGLGGTVQERFLWLGGGRGRQREERVAKGTGRMISRGLCRNAQMSKLFPAQPASTLKDRNSTPSGCSPHSPAAPPHTPRPRRLALGPSADTRTAASSAGGNQPVSLGPGQGPNPSLGATGRDKGLCAVRANTHWGVMRNPLWELPGPTLTLWPQMTAYRQPGDNPGRETISRLASRPLPPPLEQQGCSCLSRHSRCGRKASGCPVLGPGPCQARSRDELLTGPLSAQSFPRLRASSARNNKRCGSRTPQRLVPASPSR